MTTKERIKAEIEQLDDSDLQEVYELIRHILQSRVQVSENRQSPQPTSSGLCGIWQDERSAEAIIEDILNARTESREIAL